MPIPLYTVDTYAPIYPTWADRDGECAGGLGSTEPDAPRQLPAWFSQYAYNKLQLELRQAQATSSGSALARRLRYAVDEHDLDTVCYVLCIVQDWERNAPSATDFAPGPRRTELLHALDAVAHAYLPWSPPWHLIRCLLTNAPFIQRHLDDDDSVAALVAGLHAWGREAGGFFREGRQSHFANVLNFLHDTPNVTLVLWAMTQYDTRVAGPISELDMQALRASLRRLRIVSGLELTAVLAVIHRFSEDLLDLGTEILLKAQNNVESYTLHGFTYHNGPLLATTCSVRFRPDRLAPCCLKFSRTRPQRYCHIITAAVPH